MNDLISRKDVIKAVKEASRQLIDVLIDVNDEIRKIPKVEIPRWIPVTEQLPEKDGLYIVTMRGDLWGEPDVWSAISCGFYDGKWDEPADLISAWMPMPAAYEVQE